MLSKPEALAKLKKEFPNRVPKFLAPQGNLYIFVAPDPSDVEEGMSDPFFSVNSQTGEVKEFSIYGTIGNELALALGIQK